jgi:uncharacterized protein YcfL
MICIYYILSFLTSGQTFLPLHYAFFWFTQKGLRFVSTETNNMRENGIKNKTHIYILYLFINLQFNSESK